MIRRSSGPAAISLQRRSPHHVATELLFVYLYCLIDDAIKAEVLSIPRRPGPAPACTDAELLTIALVRHLLGRRSESGFLAEIRRDWAPCRCGYR